MHAVWQIQELVNLILRDIDRQSLARLAQTSHAFFDLATDALWRTIDSVVPFICCLPSDCRTRPLEATDIQRLDFYSYKIHNLVLETSNPVQEIIRIPLQFLVRYNTRKKAVKGKPWQELWTEIARLRPNSQFLPNLQRLRMNGAAENLLVPLIGITGSNLTSIYLKYVHDRNGSHNIRRFLEQLQETPKLEDLFVRDGEPDLIPLKLIQQSPLIRLRLDPSLRYKDNNWPSFKEYPLRVEILQQSKLENLTIALNQYWYSHQIKELGGKYLPALRQLWLHLTTFRAGNCKSTCITPPSPSWTSGRENFEQEPDAGHGNTCLRRSPVMFLEGLDSPALDLLNIRFEVSTTGPLFLEVIQAASRSCRLRNLTELALTGGGWQKECRDCSTYPAPSIQPSDLRRAMNMLLPMPQLKLLRISIAPNFLDILDINLYESITSGLPMLETLHLGYAGFLTQSPFVGLYCHERVRLHHLAAFCKMLPNLREVSIGNADAEPLDSINPEWICPYVKNLTVSHWVEWHHRQTDESVASNLLREYVGEYFPNSNLVEQWPSEIRLWDACNRSTMLYFHR